MLERKVEQKKSRHKENDIFKHNGKALIKINDILSLEYKNKTFRKWIKELEDANKYIEKQKEYIQQHKEVIIDFINYCGDHTDGNLKQVIDYLYYLLVINPSKEYLVCNTEDGYIVDINNINGTIIENKDIPDDICKGYYKVENGIPEKDEERYKKLYEY